MLCVAEEDAPALYLQPLRGASTDGVLPEVLGVDAVLAPPEGWLVLVQAGRAYTCTRVQIMSSASSHEPGETYDNTALLAGLGSSVMADRVHLPRENQQ